MSTYRQGDPSPIRSVDQLREAIRLRRPKPGRIGVEWELLPCRPDGSLVPFGGAGGVEAALRALVAQGYEAHREGGRTVGLSAPSGTFIGLEPGGQIEVATPPALRVAVLARELKRHARALREVAASCGWGPEAWGLAPADGPEDLPDVPKARYAILADHLRRAGRLGRRMMKLSAASQFSLDVPDDAGLALQTDGALRLLPLLVGWLANSPVFRRRRGPRKTIRPEIWRRTDRARCGLPRFLFLPGRDLVGDWVNYYLGRQALFFVRRGRWVRGDGRSFGERLKDPRDLGPLTLDDWFLHISACFPDIRFRGYLELRPTDSVPLPLLLSAAALCKGLLGDPNRVTSWRDLLPAPDPAETPRAILDAGVRGGAGAPAMAPTLLRRAADGLRALGEDPAWLAPLERAARADACPADLWRKGSGIGWRGPDLFGEGAP